MPWLQASEAASEASSEATEEELGGGWLHYFPPAHQVSPRACTRTVLAPPLQACRQYTPLQGTSADAGTPACLLTLGPGAVQEMCRGGGVTVAPLVDAAAGGAPASLENSWWRLGGGSATVPQLPQQFDRRVQVLREGPGGGSEQGAEDVEGEGAGPELRRWSVAY